MSDCFGNPRLTGPNQQHFSDCKVEHPNRGSAVIFPGVLHLKVFQLQGPVGESLGPSRQITTRPWPLHLRLHAPRCLATNGLILSLGDDEAFRGLDCRGSGKEIIDEEVLSTYYLSYRPLNIWQLLVQGHQYTNVPQMFSLASEILGINPWPNGIPNSSQVESLRKT